jgi:glycosyltransferase involved in cell wall biosynthesis
VTAGAPRVSIVLPVHDGARFLREAFDAVLGQTFADLELLIVDDASTDGSSGIIGEAAARDARVHPLRHAENRRLPAALNTGFAAARGEYLTWTSDDNRYRSEALEALVAELDAHPDADIVYADYTRLAEDGTAHAFRVLGPEALVFENVVGPCFLYRRRVHEALGGYREDLQTVEDYDFWLRAAARFALRPLHRDLYVYRDHAGSLTARQPERIAALTARVRAEHVAGVRCAPAADRARALLQLAVRAWREGERCAALARGARALRIAPLSPVSYVLDYAAGRTRVPRG